MSTDVLNDLKDGKFNSFNGTQVDFVPLINKFLVMFGANFCMLQHFLWREYSLSWYQEALGQCNLFWNILIHLIGNAASSGHCFSAVCHRILHTMMTKLVKQGTNGSEQTRQTFDTSNKFKNFIFLFHGSEPIAVKDMLLFSKFISKYSQYYYLRFVMSTCWQGTIFWHN